MPEQFDLTNIEARLKLPPREYPYWHPILVGRHLGFYRSSLGETSWLARYRQRNGTYTQSRIGGTDERRPADGNEYLTFDQALTRTKCLLSENSHLTVDPRQLPTKMDRFLYSPIGKVYTLGHALGEYLEWKRLSSSESHVYVNIALINRHILLWLGTRALSELKVEDFRTCFQHVLETCPSTGKKYTGERQPIRSLDSETLRKRRRTVNTLVTILRETLKLAWQDGRTDNDRLWRSLHRIPNPQGPRMVHLNRAECRDLLSHCDRDLRHLVTGALYTGCRSVELLKMKAADVGRDGFGIYIAPSKTHQPRFVFLPDEGMAFFLKLAARKSPNDLLFTTSNGVAWDHHLYRFRKTVKVSRVPKGFSFHGLRHTYASQLVQAGAPLTVVSEQLGHVNTVSVSRTYGHIAPQIREAEVRQRFVSLKTKGSGGPAAKEAKRLIRQWERRHDSSANATYAKITDLKSRQNIR